MTSAPQIKGWCPSAYRPMMSGDGLLVRVRPWHSRMSAQQVQGLCDTAERFGNGIINLTSRANLQIRGVTAADHDALLADLLALGLLDDDEARETRRNIITTPVRDETGLTTDLHDIITPALPDFPNLPDKMGIALDTGPVAALQNASADFRFERNVDGALILRADWAKTGTHVTLGTAVSALLDLARWFVDSGGVAARRMNRHLTAVALPDRFLGAEPVEQFLNIEPGPSDMGMVVGVPFGQVAAADLQRLVHKSGAPSLSITPWRMIALHDVEAVEDFAFVTHPDDPVMRINACPGAPKCQQAHGETLDLAREIAAGLAANTTVHVSGCAKGCAYPRRADVTVVGGQDGYGIIRHGMACDVPAKTGLSRAAVMKEIRL